VLMYLEIIATVVQNQNVMAVRVRFVQKLDPQAARAKAIVQRMITRVALN
ncbi:unnamed protein product, partial [marine sediment metagenome]